MKLADLTDARPRRKLIVCDEVASLHPAPGRRLTAQHRATRRGSTLVGPSLVALATAAAAVLAVTAVGGAGLYDSGWTTGKPATVLDERPSNDPEMRIAINQVLEQSRVPLLVSPAPVNNTPAPEPRAEQPAMPSAAADGWRRMQVLFGGSAETAAPPEAKLGEPIAVEPEYECGTPNSLTVIEPARDDGRSASEASPAKHPALQPSAASTSESNEEASAGTLSSGLSEPTSLEPEFAGEKTSAGNVESNGSAPQAITVKRMPLSEEAPPEKKRPELSPLVEPLQRRRCRR